MKLLKTKKDKEQFLFWVATLESGALLKATSTLQYGNKYCCLGIGVACTTPEKSLIFKATDYNEMLGELPKSQRNTPKWVKRVNGDFKKKYGEFLSELNDTGWSHKRIAKKLMEVYAKEL